MRGVFESKRAALEIVIYENLGASGVCDSFFLVKFEWLSLGIFDEEVNRAIRVSPVGRRVLFISSTPFDAPPPTQSFPGVGEITGRVGKSDV